MEIEFKPENHNEQRLEQVIEALADPQWQFRTIGGIAASSCLTEEGVETVLMQNPDIYRVPLYQPGDNTRLYTLGSRAPTWGERWNWIKQTLGTW